jgi:hypothetical protein
MWGGRAPCDPGGSSRGTALVTYAVRPPGEKVSDADQLRPIRLRAWCSCRDKWLSSARSLLPVEKVIGTGLLFAALRTSSLRSAKVKIPLIRDLILDHRKRNTSKNQRPGASFRAALDRERLGLRRTVTVATGPWLYAYARLMPSI